MEYKEASAADKQGYLNYLLTTDYDTLARETGVVSTNGPGNEGRTTLSLHIDPSHVSKKFYVRGFSGEKMMPGAYSCTREPDATNGPDGLFCTKTKDANRESKNLVSKERKSEDVESTEALDSRKTAEHALHDPKLKKLTPEDQAQVLGYLIPQISKARTDKKFWELPRDEQIKYLRIDKDFAKLNPSDQNATIDILTRAKKDPLGIL